MFLPEELLLDNDECKDQYGYGKELKEAVFAKSEPLLSCSYPVGMVLLMNFLDFSFRLYEGRVVLMLLWIFGGINLGYFNLKAFNSCSRYFLWTVPERV